VWSHSGKHIYFSFLSGRRAEHLAHGSLRERCARRRPAASNYGLRAGRSVGDVPRRRTVGLCHLATECRTCGVLPVFPQSGSATGNPEEVVASTREDSRGAWSPDGSQIAFNSDRNGEMNLYVHSLVDHSNRQLTHGLGGDFQPQWSPDGRRFVFFSSRAGNADIWLVDIATGALTATDLRPRPRHQSLFSPDAPQSLFNPIAAAGWKSGR